MTILLYDVNTYTHRKAENVFRLMNSSPSCTVCVRGWPLVSGSASTSTPASIVGAAKTRNGTAGDKDDWNSQKDFMS